MSALVTLLIGLVIGCLIWWAVNAILSAFAVKEPLATIIKVVFVILIVLYLLSMIGVHL